MSIIDTHVHLFSFPTLEEHRDRFRRREDVIGFRTRFPSAYARRFNEAPIDNSDALIEVMDRYGIAVALVQATRGRVSNADVAAVARRHSGRLLPLARIGADHSPTGYEGDPSTTLREAPDRIRHAVEELGARGIGETSIRALTVRRFPDEIAADLEPVMRALDRYSLPIQFPTSWTQFSGGLYYGDPMLLDDVAASYPRVPVVLTKMGRGIPYYFDMALTVARRNVNVHFDVVGTSPSHLRTALDTIGPDRIMFGTDWSATWRWLHPDVYEERFAVLERAGLSAEEREAILYRTAARLYRIDTATEHSRPLARDGGSSALKEGG